MKPIAHWVWCDLMTPDIAAATAFYGSVLGWSTAPAAMVDRHYHVISAGHAPIGGMYQTAAEGGMPPHWIGYIGVADVDSAASAITGAGGRLHHGPETLPDVGRFAVMADPQGAAFTLFAMDRGTTPWSGEPTHTPGHVGWVELHTTDWSAALEFYAAQFGWTGTNAVPMGAMGTYQLFATGGGDVGGMMNGPVGPPGWLFYFNVPDINVAATAVTKAGGAVIQDPHPVPGGSTVAVCTDPAKAMFALVQPASA